MARLDFLSGDFQQTADAEEKVDHMGNEKACKVSLDSENRQQEEKQSNIQGTGEDVDGHGPFLLPKALGHGVGNGVAVEHGGQRGEPAQKRPCLTVAV